MKRDSPSARRPADGLFRVVSPALGLALALALAWLGLGGCSPSGRDSGGPDRDSKVTPVAVARAVAEVVEGAFLEREATLHPVSQVALSTRQEGFVTTRHIEDGDNVHKGDPIVTLDDTEHRLRLAELRAALRRARATLEERRRALTRSEQLFERNVTSKGERDDLRTAAARGEADVAEARARVERATEALSEFTLRAPMDAVISRLYIEAGSYLERGDQVVHLKRIDNMLAICSVGERYLAQIHEGAAVEVLVTAYPGRVFEGMVWKIIPDALLESRSFPVRVLVPNLDQILKPGMSAQVRFVHRLDDAVLVPKDAVIGGEEAAHLYVAHEDRAERRDVELGHSVGDRWQILSGVAKDEWVIVTGNEELEPDGAIQIVELPPPSETSLPSRLEAARPEGSGS